MKYKSDDIKNICVCLLMLSLSWGNFQISGLYIYLIFLAMYCLCALQSNGLRIYYDRKDRIVLTLLVFSIVSAGFAFFSSISDSFKGYSIVMTIVLLPSYIAYTYLKHEFKTSHKTLAVCIKWIKIGFLIQIIMLPIQLGLYQIGIDFNKLVFSDILHMMENPTFFREGAYRPSGFVWHSAVLAPIFVLAYLMIRITWVRALIVLDAFICGNSTALIGVLLTVMLLFITKYNWADVFKKANKAKTISIAVILFLGVLVVALNSGILNEIIAKIVELYSRISGSSEDYSTAAHTGYYKLYPKVLSENSLSQNIFGTGYASSGYSISQISGQYAGLEHWVTESDIIDILISRGILGAILYYYFLIKIMVQGRKIDRRYMIAMIVIMLQGITYNVQFEYIFFIELIMYASICTNLNFFGENNDNKELCIKD